MVKLTFSLDQQTVDLLRHAAERSRKPQSLIVREAIVQYAGREEKLSAEDQERLLAVVHRMKNRPATRSQAEVESELKDVRRARRTGWHRTAR